MRGSPVARSTTDLATWLKSGFLEVHECLGMPVILAGPGRKSSGPNFKMAHYQFFQEIEYWPGV
jgi:hypothetical protein